MKHVDESILTNDSESATQLHVLAEQMGQDAKNEKLVKAIFAQGKYLASFKKSLEKYQQASKKLQAQPNDPEACLLVGQHACFFNGDWAKGLPLLAKSTDPKVKLAATKDLEAHDNDVTSRLAAADAWYDVLTSMDPYSRKLLSQRIQSVYSKSIVVTSGLTKLKIEPFNAFSL